MLLVLISVPSEAVGLTISKHLVENHLAACAHIMAPHIAVYRWQGVVETTPEYNVLIKTTEARYAEVEAAVLSLHPYELPGILKIKDIDANAPYLRWVLDNTGNK